MIQNVEFEQMDELFFGNGHHLFLVGYHKLYQNQPQLGLIIVVLGVMFCERIMMKMIDTDQMFHIKVFMVHEIFTQINLIYFILDT
ncbi:MAG: hypothetical protein ACOZBL_01205 [Patescibacteria group bacterium]